MEKYIEALKGISYFEWIKLREGMDNEFNRLIGESKRKLELTDVERVEKTIRSQFGYHINIQRGGVSESRYDKDYTGADIFAGRTGESEDRLRAG